MTFEREFPRQAFPDLYQFDPYTRRWIPKENGNMKFLGVILIVLALPLNWPYQILLAIGLLLVLARNDSGDSGNYDTSIYH